MQQVVHLFKEFNFSSRFLEVLKRKVEERELHNALSIVPSKSEIRLRQRRALLDNIANKLNIQTQEDWYGVSGKQVATEGGAKILHRFGNSLYRTLSTVYPEFVWNAAFFPKAPLKYWTKKQNQRKYMDWIADRLNITKQEEWYDVPSEYYTKYGATTILNHYNHSIYSALKSIYPEYEWHSKLFSSSKISNFWRKTREMKQRQQLDSIALRLGIEKQEEWYTVTSKAVRKLPAGKFISDFYDSSLFAALRTLYPEFDWNPQLCVTPPRSSVYKKSMGKTQVLQEVQNQREEVNRLAWLRKQDGISD